MEAPHYVINLRHHVLPSYSHFSTAPVIPIRRCNSENSLNGYIVCPKYQKTDNTLQVGLNNLQPVTVLSNPVTTDHANNKAHIFEFHVSENKNDDVASTTRSSYVAMH